MSTLKLQWNDNFTECRFSAPRQREQPVATWDPERQLWFLADTEGDKLASSPHLTDLLGLVVLMIHRETVPKTFSLGKATHLIGE